MSARCAGQKSVIPPEGLHVVRGQRSRIHRASPVTVSRCPGEPKKRLRGRRSGPRCASRNAIRRGVSTRTRSANPTSMRAPPTTPSHHVNPPRPVKAKDPELAVTGSALVGLEDPPFAFVAAATVVVLPAAAAVTDPWLGDGGARPVG